MSTLCVALLHVLRHTHGQKRIQGKAGVQASSEMLIPVEEDLQTGSRNGFHCRRWLPNDHLESKAIVHFGRRSAFARVN